MNDTNERSVASDGSTAHDEAHDEAHDRKMTGRIILGTLEADVIQAASASPKPILIAIRMHDCVPADALRMIQDYFQPIGEQVGVPFVVVPKGMTLEAVLGPRDGVQ